MGAAGRAASPPVALRPLGIGELLDAAIKVYRRRPGPMVIATAVTIFPAIVLQTLIQISGGSPDDITPVDPTTGLREVDGAALATFLGATVASSVVLAVASSLAVAATTRLSLSAYLGDEVGWRESLRFAFRRVVPLVGLMGLTLLGQIAGVLACLVGYVWLMGVWAVAVPALLVEEVRPVEALRRSYRLVRGRFWPVLGTVVLGLLLVSLVQGVLTAPVLVLQLVEASPLLTGILSGVATFVGVSLATPLTAALAAVIYVDLRVRKEGYDLELMAAGVGADASAAPPSPWTAPPPPAGPVAPPGGWGRPAGG